MPTNKISTESLLAEIERVDSEVEGTPQRKDMDEHGKYCGATYTTRFGSWEGALDEAGISHPEVRNDISREEFLTEIRRVDEVVDGTPKQADMEEHGKYSVGGCIYRFGTWNTALKEAGVGDRPERSGVSDEELIEEIRIMALAFERPPKADEMAEVGEYAFSTYLNRFGSWNESLEAAGIEVEETNDGEVTREDLLGEIRRLTDELGHAPTTTEFLENGAYSKNYYNKRFEGWKDVLMRSGVHPSQS